MVDARLLHQSRILPPLDALQLIPAHLPGLERVRALREERSADRTFGGAMNLISTSYWLRPSSPLPSERLNQTWM